MGEMRCADWQRRMPLTVANAFVSSCRIRRGVWGEEERKGSGGGGDRKRITNRSKKKKEEGGKGEYLGQCWGGGYSNNGNLYQGFLEKKKKQI